VVPVSLRWRQVTGSRKLHKELHNLYQINEDKMGGACSAHGQMRNTYRILAGKPKRTVHLEDQTLCG
jgi:hypothetical protein